MLRLIKCGFVLLEKVTLVYIGLKLPKLIINGVIGKFLISKKNTKLGNYIFIMMNYIFILIALAAKAKMIFGCQKKLMEIGSPP